MIIMHVIFPGLQGRGRGERVSERLDLWTSEVLRLTLLVVLSYQSSNAKLPWDGYA